MNPATIICLFFLLSTLPALFSARNKTYIISDLHLGSSWFSDPDHIIALDTFLRQLTDPETDCNKLVINGDLIESWLVSFYTMPTPYSHIMQFTDSYGANIKEYIEIMKNITQNGIEIIYTRGNHDIEMQPSDFESVGLSVTYAGDVYVQNNLRVEHGHLYDLFNSPDPTGMRPFGYYVSRAASTLIQKTAGYSSLTKFICDEVLASDTVITKFRNDFSEILKRFVEAALSQSVLSILGLTKYNAFKYVAIRDGCFWGLDHGDVTLGLAIQKYKKILDRHLSVHDLDYVSAMVKGSCIDFDYFIRQMKEDVVVMGHTHKKRVAKFTRPNTGPILYINGGAWTNDVSALTYTTVEFDSSGLARSARLMQYFPNGTSLILSNEPVSLSMQVKNIPPSWTCSSASYADGATCDCSCGAYDPDCDDQTLKIVGCVDTVPNLSVTCSAVDGSCEYTSHVPSGWTCPTNEYFSQYVCRCGCGALDPSCAFSNLTLGCTSSNPDDIFLGCASDGSCIYESEGLIQKPFDWTCPVEFYGNQDGCDCKCGGADADCAASDPSKCSCNGSFKDVVISSFEVGFWILLGISLAMSHLILLLLCILCICGICCCVRARRRVQVAVSAETSIRPPKATPADVEAQ